jgi:hypothetical protein
MTSLKSLAQSAMLGTGNGFVLPESETLKILEPLRDSDPEAGLLDAAVLIGVGEIGGRVLLQLESVETACPVETRRQMSEPAAGILMRILAGEFEALLPEFLQQAAAKDWIAPPETLPSLLGFGKKEMRPLVLAVAGERGRWLAAHNPAWAYALAPVEESTWETGMFEQRLALLVRLRAAAPERARELIQITWEQDPPEARTAFVAAFTTGLSMEDEPFLEACLDDGRKEVREAARSLLVRLPESRLVKRSVARLEPLLKYKSRFLGGDTLEVTLPEAVDAAAKRDGAGGPILRKNLGEKANWLAQMLSVVPPSLWSRLWNRSPEKLLQAALASEWKEALLLGWLLAVGRCGDPEWAAALAEAWVRQAEVRTALAGNQENITRSLRVEKLEALAKASITRAVNELDDQHPLLDLLEKFERPWSDRLAQTVMASVRRQAGGYPWRLMRALPVFALHIPPALADEFAEDWPVTASGWDAWVTPFNAVLRFRKEMMEVL